MAAGDTVRTPPLVGYSAGWWQYSRGVGFTIEGSSSGRMDTGGRATWRVLGMESKKKEKTPCRLTRKRYTSVNVLTVRR